MGKLLGRTAGAEIVEPISKEPPQNSKNNNILSTKVQNSIPRHDPFNLKVDADTNFKIVEQVLVTQTSTTAVPTETTNPVSGNLHTNTKITSRIGVEVVSADVAPSVDSENNKNTLKLYSSDIERTASTSTSDLNTPVQLTRSSLRSEKVVPILKVR